MDVKNIGIGSDLCIGQPDEVVEWMRNGTWSKIKLWRRFKKNLVFQNNLNGLKMQGFKNLESGLKKVGFSEVETNGILGNNGYNVYKGI